MTAKKFLSDWLKGETDSPKDFSRETVTLLSGEELVTGAVLGKVTATGKYAEFNAGAGDGLQTAAGILILDTTEPDTTQDTSVAIIARDAVIVAEGLTWKSGTTTNQKNAALASLRLLGILVRGAA